MAKKALKRCLNLKLIIFTLKPNTCVKEPIWLDGCALPKYFSFQFINTSYSNSLKRSKLNEVINNISTPKSLSNGGSTFQSLCRVPKWPAASCSPQSDSARRAANTSLATQQMREKNYLQKLNYLKLFRHYFSRAGQK